MLWYTPTNPQRSGHRILDLKKMRQRKRVLRNVHRADKTFAYYTNTHTMHPDDVKGLDWSSIPSQEIRFQILLEAIKEKKASDTILDVGCGYGDLSKFVTWTPHYYGIDFVPEMIATAKNRYPNVNFRQASLSDEKRMYDWVLASGPFNVKSKNNSRYLEQAVTRMWQLSAKGVAFNILISGSGVTNKDMYFYDPAKVLTFCRSLTSFVVCRTDYLPHDGTYYLFHQAP